MNRLLSTLFAGIALSVFLCPPAAAGEGEDRASRLEIRRRCRVILKQATGEIESGEYDSAAVHLKLGLECDPKNPDVFYHLGRVSLLMNDSTEAASILARGVEKAPLSSRLKLLLARLKIAAGAIEEASELVERVLAIKPREAEALYLRGWIQLEQGDSTGTLETWEKSLETSLGKNRS